jgi:hypothetical protein
VERTDLQNTSAEAWKLLLARVRELTPEERVRMTFERVEAALGFRKRTEHLPSKLETD